MIAFHGNKAVKAKYLRRVRAHAKADELIQGTGWENGKGCAVGCTLHAYDHSLYPKELGVPLVLAHLEDRIFEGLSNGEARGWPAAFLAAIVVGSDLSMVWPRFAVWLLRDELAKHDKGGHCERVAKLYDRWIAGTKPADSEWRDERAAADDAAADAAYYAYAADAAAAAAAVYYYAAAAAYYAAAAAYYAADAAAAAAYAAAYAADADADADAARRAFWKRSSEKLIELLRAAKV